MSGRNFFSDAQRNGVFAFIDFKAWNGAYGAGDVWRKFTHSQTASAADANLVKTEINERVFSVFFLYYNLKANTGIYWWAPKTPTINFTGFREEKFSAC